jgi:hypothetical protein
MRRTHRGHPKPRIRGLQPDRGLRESVEAAQKRLVEAGTISPTRASAIEQLLASIG